MSRASNAYRIVLLTPKRHSIIVLTIIMALGIMLSFESHEPRRGNSNEQAGLLSLYLLRLFWIFKHIGLATLWVIRDDWAQPRPSREGN